MNLFVLAAYGVYPARTAGHLAIAEPLSCLAGQGHAVDLVTVGLRSFERRLPLSFRQVITEGLVEHRLVDPVRLALLALRGETRLPPVSLSAQLGRAMPKALLARLEDADLCQIEGPWPYEFARAHFPGPIVFVAHNVESDLHADALRDRGGEPLLARARALEGRAFRESDLALVFHDDDLARLCELYGERAGPCRVIPLGTDVLGMRRPTAEERAAAKSRLEVAHESVVAVFAASAHAPNQAAARFAEECAARLRHEGVTVLIAGSVCDSPRTFRGGRATGPLPSLDLCYTAADLALNPMFDGSGMNQKVAEALAWSLPVVSTPFGARGFQTGDGMGIVLAEPDAFEKTILELARDPARREQLARAARRHAEKELDWTQIALKREAAYLSLCTQEPPKVRAV